MVILKELFQKLSTILLHLLRRCRRSFVQYCVPCQYTRHQIVGGECRTLGAANQYESSISNG